MSRRAIIVLVTSVFISSLTAFAANVHLKGGANAAPVFNDQGLTLSASSALAGLGNGDVLVILNASANPTGRCCNPSGECKVPGQNPAPVQVTGSEAIPASEIKNGSVNFAVVTEPPTTPIPGAPDCPGSSWTESITNMSFTSATITVLQNGQTVFTLSCTFSSPTSDGRVSSQNVTCS
jgi:hypothetical protein